jgi:hypothetical protein
LGVVAGLAVLLGALSGLGALLVGLLVLGVGGGCGSSLGSRVPSGPSAFKDSHSIACKQQPVQPHEAAIPVGHGYAT